MHLLRQAQLCCIALLPFPWGTGVAVAQVVIPDGSLGTQVQLDPLEQSFSVTGGALRGINLFHSFETFSPGTGDVRFDLQVNGFEEVERIFSRVTGGEVSHIDGLLQTLGGNAPDLFLLNPQGVVFGPNARLDLGGSLIGTTAEAIQFGDGFRFSTTVSPSDTLLSLSVPVGLQLGQDAGAISLIGPGHEISVPPIAELPTLLQAAPADYEKGLRLASGNTLALIGNGIRLEGGTLQSQFPQGGVQFSLGSGSDGVVEIQPETQWGWSFDYGNLQSSSDIWLGNQARIDGSGGLPSRIQVSGKNVTLAEGTAVYSQNLGIFPNGAITFQVDELLTLAGSTDPGKIPSSVRNSSLSLGDGGAIDIKAGDLLLWGGGNIATNSFSNDGDSGNIKIDVENDIRLTSFLEPQAPSPFLTFIISSTWAEGDGGLIDVKTGNLRLENGVLISSSALFSSGNSNDLNIAAEDSIVIEGFNPENDFISAISSSSFSLGNAGSINVVTPRLSLFDGGFISASVYKGGDAGNITVNASELIEIRNRGLVDESFLNPSISSNAINNDNAVLRRLFDIVGQPTGGAGSVIIQTPNLQLSKNGGINVTNEGSGDAGELEITAQILSLDQATLRATTEEGNGGNITLQGVDTLTLRNESKISASAGGQGNGGNIDIAAKTIIAKPSENNDITANAVGSAGGTIMLDTSALLGLEVRPQPTKLSDITTSSELGANFSGTVEFAQPNTVPDSALAVLPDATLEPIERLAQGCDVGEAEFQISGRGGLARSPLDLLELDLALSEQGASPVLAKQAEGQSVAGQAPQQGHEPRAQEIERLAQAIALRDQGFYPQALSHFQALSRSKSVTTMPRLQVQVLRQLGITYRLLGQLESARIALNQSLALAREQALPQEGAATALSLGHLAQTEGELDRANQLYQHVLSEGSITSLNVLALASLMGLELDRNRWGAAQQWRQQLLEQLNSQPESSSASTARLHGVAVQLEALQARGQVGSPNVLAMLRTDLQVVLSLAKQQENSQAMAYGLGYLGQVEERSGNWKLAQQYSEAALQQAQSNELMQYQWAWQLGRIARHRWQQTGQADWYEESLVAYRLALTALQSLRSDLVTVAPELQVSFRSAIEPVYREYVDLLLAQSDEKKSKVMTVVARNAQLQEAIDTVEALRLAELDNYLQDACLTTTSRSVAEIDPAAAVIYPIILDDRLEVIVSRSQGEMSRFSLPVTRSQLEQTLKAFRDGLVWRSQRDFNQPSQQLYQWLIQPIVADLQADAVETLVFVPDGMLKSIPLAALSDGDQYLIEQFQVATVPGIELLPSQKQERGQRSSLVAGVTEKNQGFVPLPFVADELNDIQMSIPGPALVNEQFTRQSLTEQLKQDNASIVHIATHGQFSSKASETFVLAWNERIRLMELGKILRRRAGDGLTPIELLVLSACETAVGDEASALGLAGMAVQSGARSTLASLWSVNDQSTAMLMNEFYKQLSQPGVPKAAALRQTQLAMLENPVYRHPYYWSAFVLLGDWQ